MDSLPPALRMAAMSGNKTSSNTTNNRPTTSTPSRRTGGNGRLNSTIPGKSKSFQLRKDQIDALSKLRMQPRSDMATENERRKQTLIRRQQQKERHIQSQSQQQEQQQKNSSNDNINDITHSKEWQQAYKVLQKKLEKVQQLLQQEEHDNSNSASKVYAKYLKKRDQYQQELQQMNKQKLEAEAEAEQAKVKAKAKVETSEKAEVETKAKANPKPKPKPQTKPQAETQTQAQAHLLSSSPYFQKVLTPFQQKDCILLQKKLQKLQTMMMDLDHDHDDDDDDKHKSSNKTYIKYTNKQKDYQAQLQVYQQLIDDHIQSNTKNHDDDDDDDNHDHESSASSSSTSSSSSSSSSASTSSKKSESTSASASKREEEEEEAAKAADTQAEEQRAREQEEERQRQLQERQQQLQEQEEKEKAEALALAAAEKEEEEEEEQHQRKQAEEEERRLKEQEEQKEVVLNSRQLAIQRFKEQQAHKKAQEERSKEYKILKKKLTKVESMLEDLDQDNNKNDNDKRTKFLKKKEEYLRLLDDFDEWAQELQLRQKEKEDIERRRQEQLAEEQRRKDQAEQRRKEEEEKTRRKAEEEEARRIREEQEAEEQRIAYEQQQAREAEIAEQQRIAEEERLVREAEEAEQLRVAEEERLIREAQESKEREREEAEEAERKAEQAKLDAERHEQEMAEQAKRREELREQTRVAEAEAEAAATTNNKSIDDDGNLEESEPSREFIDIKNIPQPHSENTKKILGELHLIEIHQGRLEKTLKQHGIAIIEDIPYEVSKKKIAELQDQMKTLSMSEDDPYVVQKKYYALEEEMSKFVTAMMLTDEFAEEQRLAEEKWEESILSANIEALRKVRQHMPVNIRNMTEEQLTTNPSPNGKELPKAMARKFKRTNVLQLLRVNPQDLERMHPSLIEGLRTTGLTLTERRALHEHLKEIGLAWESRRQDPSIERKYSWFLALRMKFKEMVTAYDNHVAEYGQPGNHPYAKRNDPGAGGCPLLGNQCPVKANSTMSYDTDYGYTPEAEYEGGTSATSSSPTKTASNKYQKSSAGSKAKDENILEVLKERIHYNTSVASEMDGKLLRELLFAEKRSLNLEKQLAQNAIALPKEDIPFAVAKAKVAEITEDIKVVAGKMMNTVDMKEMAALEKEYSQLSDDLEKYNNALMLTKEWAEEILNKEREWEDRVRPINVQALQKIRRHMPVNIKDLSEQDMIQGSTPNGRQLPQKIVRKFKRTNILQLVRIPPSQIEPMHPSSLEGMRSTGLTLTERRALHEHLKELGAKWKAASNDKMSERKWMWHESLRGKFKELVNKYQGHIDEFGPPENHTCKSIGKQCAIKADQEIDYDEDYGFPCDDIYNVEKVKKSNLLTVEELERRKQEDDWGYDAAVEEEEESAPVTASTGLMVAGGAKAKPDSQDRPKAPGGLLAAIQSKPSSSGDDDKGRPQAPGGLLAAIQSKGDAASGITTMNRPKPPGGLLAAIQSKGNTGENTDTPKAPGGLLAAIQAKGKDGEAVDSPTKKKRGGLLAAIAGRRKKS